MTEKINIRHLLVPIDFSKTSADALRHAAAFATWYDARITALHAIRPVFLPMANVATDAILRASTPGPDHPQVEQAIRRFVREAGLDDLTVEVMVVDGEPSHAIVDHAAALQHVVIVMGTHGRSGFNRLMLGSVTETVLRRAPCPVITVPPASLDTSKLPLKRLLCAIDFSPSSLEACRFAMSVAEESDAHLTLLHVVQWPAGAEDTVAEIAPRVTAYRRGFEDEAQEQLEGLIPEEARTWCDPVCRIDHGQPRERIIETAANEQADLIVIGLHGRHVFDLTLFGSTAIHVIRHATCPVLALRQFPK